jgi:ABC-type phosphate transport system substrate-binding protein
MNTKMKLIAAAAAMFVCDQALAVGPGTTPDYTFYMGGGSAQAPAVRVFAEAMFSSYDVYTDQACNGASTKQGSNYTAVYGVGKTIGSDSTFSGKNVLIVYGNNGGTFLNGVGALVNATSITYPNFLLASACSGATAPTPTYSYTGTSTVSSIPVLGLSDEEMSLFTGVNLPFAYGTGPAQVAPSVSTISSNTTATSLYDDVFGVAETPKLAAQKQNFTTAEVAAIWSGNYTDWSQMVGDQGTYAGVALPAGAITIIDRAAGSGSKASFNSYFLHNPGATAAGGSIPPANVSGGYGDCGAPTADNYSTPMPGATLTGTVAGYDETNGGDCSQSSNGNVKTAMDNAATDNVRAVGLLGLAYQPVSGTDTYTFASLNGIHVDGSTTKTCGNATAYSFEPANVQSGAYDLFYTDSIQYRKISLNGAPYHDGSSANSKFIDDFLSESSNPVNQVSVSGIMVDPVIAGAGPGSQAYAACIAKGTHNKNSTAPLQLIY